MARTELLEDATATFAERFRAVSSGGLSLASDESITTLLGSLGDVRRSVDAIGAALAAELHARSEVPDTSLARRLGEASPAIAVARLVGIDPGEAHDWCAAGLAARARMSFTGELLTPRYEATADAMTRAQLTPRAIRTIADTLDSVAERASVGDVADVESVLLSYAPALTSRELNKLCRQVIDRFDPDGAEPREERLRAKSGVKIITGRDGLITWIVSMHPEAAGFLTAAVDARTAPQRALSFIDTELDAAPFDPTEGDTRTTPQKRLDALVDIARESLAHDDGQLAGTAVTLNVTMTLESLMSGLGAANIDGVDEPISAGSARRLAADARIIPIVLGGESQPLDVGQGKRLYTEAQRRALAVRDGGCIWPGCNAPPGWCEVAHLLAWSLNGPTDFTNGALMCRTHHRRFDHDDWELESRDGALWLIPPPWVDPNRVARRAGRLPVVV